MASRAFGQLEQAEALGNVKPVAHPSDRDSQLSSSVAVVDLTQDRVGELDAVDAPATLRRHIGRSVVEGFVIRLKETAVGRVGPVVEYLLRKLVTVRRCVCS